MEPEEVARNMGIARIVFGIGFLLTPGLTGRFWVGDLAGRGGVKVLVQAVGVRDLAMGLGILSGKSQRTWLQLTALSDAADFVATLLAGDALPPLRRRLTLAIAASSTAQGLYAAQGVDAGGSN